MYYRYIHYVFYFVFFSVINPIMTAKLDSYQEEMIILCLEKGVLSIKEISSKNIEGKGLPCIIIYSATSGW